MPTLSIIVTSYNIEPYLSECLDSIRGQSLEDIEIIVVDDGSSDGSPEIIRRHAEADARIKPILFTENTIGGVASAANAGLDAATGDYIGFADGDDLYERDMFEKLVTAAQGAGADLAMCRYLLLDAQSGAHSEPAEQGRWLEIRDGEIWDLDEAHRKQLLKFIAVPWRKIYRREMIERRKIRFPVGDYFFEDNPFHWFTALSANRVAFVPEVLCYHRVAREGQTMQSAGAALFRMFEHHDTIRGWLENEGLFSTYRLELLGWVTSQLEWISRRADASALPELFTRMAPIAKGYTAEDVDQMLERSRKGKRAQDMLVALRGDDQAGFSLAAGQPAAQSGLIASGMAHLKAKGFRETAILASRYLGRKAGAKVGITRLPQRRPQPRNDELYFALTVLQQQMTRLEGKLDRLTEQSENTPDTTKNGQD